MKGFDGLIVRVAAACRSFHTFSSSFSAAAPLNKSSLSTLRKRTGYTFANCKRALEQFGDDLQKAEAWLRDQAQKEGWAKATKLQDRVAVQGLVGVKYKPEDGIGVLVEVNCETDFVARNAKFQELVSTIAECCAREVDLKPIDGASYHKWSLTPERIGKFRWNAGSTLADMTALAIGQMGENMILRRAVLIKTDPRECRISGYAHAAETTPAWHGCLLGRYGALVIYRQTGKVDGGGIQSSVSVDDVGRQLCQHVVGMNPQSIGSIQEIDEGQQEQGQRLVQGHLPESGLETREGQETSTEEQLVQRKRDDEETQLVRQEFIAEPTLTVGEVLQQTGLQVLDFVRYECGGAEVSADQQQSAQVPQ